MKVWRVALTPWCGLVAMCIAEGINLAVGPQPWRGELLLGVLWAWTALYLCGPVIAAVAAYDGARLFPSRGHTVWNLADVRRRCIRDVWGTGVAASAAPALAVCAWVYGQAGNTFPEARLSAAVAVMTGVLTLGGVVGLGLAAGHLAGRIYGPLAAFGGMLVLQMASYLGAAPVLQIGGVSDSLLGLRSTPAALVMQVGGAGLLVAAAWYALVGGARRASGGPHAWAVVLGVVVLAAVAPMATLQRFEPVSDLGDARTCVQMRPDGRTPGRGDVCVYQEHARLHPAVMAAWGEVTMSAERAGVTSMPTTLHEWPVGAGPGSIPTEEPGSTVGFTFTRDQLDVHDGRVTTEWLISQITNPVWCTGLWAEDAPGPELTDTAQRAADALTTITGRSTRDVKKKAARQFDEAWTELKTCPGVSR